MLIYILWYLLLGAIFGALTWNQVVDFAYKSVEEDKASFWAMGMSEKTAVKYLIISFSVVIILIWPYFALCTIFERIKRIFGGKRK